MADPYSKLRNLNKRLDGLGAQEDEAIAAVKARYAEKRKRLRAVRFELLCAVTAVKGDYSPSQDAVWRIEQMDKERPPEGEVKLLVEVPGLPVDN